MPKITALMLQVRTASAAAANISDGYIHSVYGDGFPVKKKKSLCPINRRTQGKENGM
ncbi:hypothetical protein [Butyricicoccus intestinisimiae]|uniref:Cyclic lactone autoinducer peptide n=1 Tax=Butyricicoccus intestinisimiae TaxID=2841509 RepID=A0ABS6EPY8_9FIRM|nr:hypothetical protein [Butyricicoccus intestinisimiae]MBU5489560.1 hypothetical protein [Butyricicoccus intestinisimiae]